MADQEIPSPNLGSSSRIFHSHEQQIKFESKVGKKKKFEREECVISMIGYHQTEETSSRSGILLERVLHGTNNIEYIFYSVVTGECCFEKGTTGNDGTSTEQNTSESKNVITEVLRTSTSNFDDLNLEKNRLKACGVSYIEASTTGNLLDKNMIDEISRVKDEPQDYEYLSYHPSTFPKVCKQYIYILLGKKAPYNTTTWCNAQLKNIGLNIGTTKSLSQKKTEKGHHM